MSVPQIKSEAFDRAALRSERTRIVGLLAVLGAALVMIFLRAGATGTAEERDLLFRFAVLLVLVVIYELTMLGIVWRVLDRGGRLSDWVWPANLFVETLLPTSAILLLTQSNIVGPYRALVAPAALTYFFFIVLSTLRLNPHLSRLTGIFATTGYLVMVTFTYQRYPDVDPTVVPFTLPYYLTYAAFILIGGFVAGTVASEIRIHVDAALSEARQVERLEHDLSIASSIQKGLLPEGRPEIEGFEIAGWNQPADQTGGDYFDWQEMPDGRLVVTLADVTGHGIGPALVTAACRAYARASFPGGNGIRAATDRINRLLVEDLPPERFVTFVVAHLDPATSTVEMLSAGQAPLLLYRPDIDTFESFDADGIPLGLMSAIEYPVPQEVSLRPGDLLLLMTDGFFEWADSRDEQFGVNRVEGAIRRARDLPVDRIIAEIYKAVTEFSGGTPQDDDLTAVIVRKTAS